MDSFASSGRKHVNSLSDLRMIWDDAHDLRAIDMGDAKVLLDHTARQSPAATEHAASTFSRPRCQSIRVEHVFITTDDVMAGRGPRFGVLENRILNSALQLQNSIETELRNSLGRGHEPGLVLQFAPDPASSRRKPTHLFLLTAYAFIIIYISRGLVNLRKVHSRFGLAFTGTIQLLISMITSVSICALLGIRLTLVPWELLPFVIVVVGSENMYSLTKAIVDTPLSLPVSSRIAHGLGKVGLPITLTTLADIVLLLVIALFIGVRAVREFCIFAVFSLVMDWFLQMSFFVTILSIDMQRLELADLLTQGTRISRKQDSLSQSHDRHLNGPGSTNNDDADRKPHPARHQRNGAEGRSGNIVIAALSKVWNARTARTASLTLILVYMGGLYLYYGTGYPSHQKTSYVLPDDWDTIRQPPSTDSAFDPYGHLDNNGHAALPWWTSSPSADLWTSLNPLGAEELRIDVKPWTILSLRSSTEGQTPPSVATFAGWALFRPRIRAVVWFAKLVVLPISGTTALLWMLLLYLLKDTELLDAQRDKSEADPSDSSNGSADPASHSSVTSRTTVIASAHSCDIEFLVHDGGLAASIDNGGGIHVWRLDGGGAASEDARRTSSP
uniref:SSD domain-containing protein n=1 Tax=Kalmanozyma brasiliensis (strain GHG001) TaxID=1365824 RepID=V5EU67_KALBG